MSLTSLKLTFGLAVAFLAMAAGSGCARVQVPAIDPSGQRIFSGGSTTLLGPDLASCPLIGRPASVATSGPPVAAGPVVKPPCVAQPLVVQPVAVQPVPVVVQPVAAPISQPNCGPQGCPNGPQLKLCPSQLVAPVGSEVVLAAGLCGPGGYYVTQQPLEWMVAPDGVGHIVQVGKEANYAFSSYFRGTPHKVAPNYVRAHTSTTAQTITRGTPSRCDDINLGKGQSWISVTSPTEGTTNVTVWAPKEGNWDRRRQNATIYWVDARWKFPPPAIVRSAAGGKHVLTTSLTRSGGAPIAGWLVRYDVLEGPNAVFGAANERSIEARTQGDGTARAELLATSGQAGITTVRVQIIRPQTKPGDLPTMIVGQGITSVTWSAPGLHCQAVGPETSPVDSTLNYRVEVFNSGDTVAKDVKLSFTPPKGVTFLNATPAGASFGQMHQWRIGDLQPGTASTVEVNCRATMAADIRACFRAESAEKLVSEGCVSTRVFASALSVKMTGPETTEVGKEAQFKVEVTNTGRTPLANVTITDNFDPGLSHLDGEASPIVKTIETISPNETKRFAVTFRVAVAGKHCHRLDVTADGGHAAAARSCVTGVQPAAAAPQVSLRVVGPSKLETGKKGVVEFEIRNDSAAAINNVRLSVEHSASVEAVRASLGPPNVGNKITWLIPRMMAGEAVLREIEFQGAAVDPRSLVRATITSDQSAAQSKDLTLAVVAAAAAPAVPRTTPIPGGAAAPPPATNANNLKVSLVKMNDPIAVGGQVKYVVTIDNKSTSVDENVALTLLVPEGLKVSSIAPATQYKVSATGAGSVELEPIKTIRPNETLPTLEILVTGERVGKFTFKVDVRSKLNPQGFEVETVSEVFAPMP